jgi:hypothetical protein
MDLRWSFWAMFVSSFLIQFFVMGLIMSNSVSNITFSVGKFYMSVIMAMLMGLIEVGMYDYHMSLFSLSYYLSLFIGLSVFIYLYKTQKYIYDEDYLKEMIEHHSMALLTSEEILQKTDSERVKKLAEGIVSTQKAEINYMKQLLIYQ